MSIPRNISRGSFPSIAEAKKAGWFSRRHETSAEHHAAQLDRHDRDANRALMVKEHIEYNKTLSVESKLKRVRKHRSNVGNGDATREYERLMALAKTEKATKKSS